MTTQSWIALAVIGLFAGLLVAMQVAVRRRSRALAGNPVGPLPGPLGARVARAEHALLYFWSPTCSACRVITPRIRELARTNPDVVPVDVTADPELARALGVMATPTFVELGGGTLLGHHVGPPPRALLARFS